MLFEEEKSNEFDMNLYSFIIITLILSFAGLTEKSYLPLFAGGNKHIFFKKKSIF